jgi:hypothetical protein
VSGRTRGDACCTTTAGRGGTPACRGRGRQGPLCRRPWTGPNDGAVNVANVHGCSATLPGMPLPPSSAVTTTWKASPLYRLEHGSHTDARRFPHGSQARASSSWSEEYTVWISPVVLLTIRVAPRILIGRAQPRARFCADPISAEPRSSHDAARGSEAVSIEPDLPAVAASMSSPETPSTPEGQPWPSTHQRAVLVTPSPCPGTAVAGGPGTVATTKMELCCCPSQRPALRASWRTTADYSGHRSQGGADHQGNDHRQRLGQDEEPRHAPGGKSGARVSANDDLALSRWCP